MKKLSILLLVLCLLLPAAAMAANPAVEIGGIELPNGYYMASGTNVPVAEKPDGGYAYLKDGVLTLNNYSLTSPSVATLYVRGDALTINLMGTNSLVNTYFDEGYGIWLARGASLTIGGTGALSVKGSYGICSSTDSKSLHFTGGKVTIHARETGLDLYNDLLISGGELTVTTDAFSGIKAADLSIAGGKVTVSATNHIGILADVITITGGTTTVNAEHVGIEASDTLRISGADTVVDLTCSDKENDRFTLLSYRDLRIDSPLAIVAPEGGVIGHYDPLLSTVLDIDGNPAKHARIAKPAPVVTPTPAPTVPATGDSSAVALWCALAVLAMAGAVLIRKRAYR